MLETESERDANRQEELEAHDGVAEQGGTGQAQIGALQYDFFGGGGGADDGLGDLEGLEGGLEEGVDAPPEEDYLGTDDPGFLEELEGEMDGSGGAAALDQLQEEHLSHHFQAQNLAQRSAPSFVSDPVAATPLRSSSIHSDRSIGRPQSSGRQASIGIDARRSLDGGGGLDGAWIRPSSTQPIPEPNASQGEGGQGYNPWGGQSPAFTQISEGLRSSSYSTQQPSAQPYNWQQQEQLPPQIPQPQAPLNSPQPYTQPAPPQKRTMTLQELEAQLLAPKPPGGNPPAPTPPRSILQRIQGPPGQPPHMAGSPLGPPPMGRDWHSTSLPSGVPSPGAPPNYMQSPMRPGGSTPPHHILAHGIPHPRPSPAPAPTYHVGNGMPLPRGPHLGGYGPPPGTMGLVGGMPPHPQAMMRPLYPPMPPRPPGPPYQPQGRGFPPGGFRPQFPPPGPHFRPPGMHMGPQQGQWQWGGSKHMEAEEIDSILRIQWKSLHNGSAYQEDYYYQAFVNRRTNGANRRAFAPDALRDLAPAEKLGAEPAAYVKLDGLGKIAYSSIKRPRPLMDLIAGPVKTGGEEKAEEGVGRAKPLDQEPQLAARIVIEDCMCLLLDVDDIDRVWAASGGQRDDEHLLRQRRSLLLDAFASSLRLPEGALPPPGNSGASDDVFVRLMGLHKGRSLLARALRLMAKPLANPTGYGGPAGRRPPPLRIMWAALRNVRLLFSVSKAGDGKPESAEAAERTVEATRQLAVAAIDVMRRLESARAICDCMAALVQGDLNQKQDTTASTAAQVDNLLPLSPSGEAAGSGTEWLGEVATALLQRAQELRLAQRGGGGASGGGGEGLAVPEGVAWQKCFALFFNLLHRHLQTLSDVYHLAQEAGVPEAAKYAKDIMPVGLIRAALPHADEAQREQLRTTLSKLGP